MKLTFIGSGSAFTVGGNNYQSNLLLSSDNNEKLLIDCGTDARIALFELGYTYKDISNVYITHLHGDHVGGLEWLAFTRKFDPTCDKPNLYIQSGLMEDLWNKVLSGGLSSIQGEKACLKTFFNPIPVDKHFQWEGIKFELIETLHVINNDNTAPCFGLMTTIDGIKVYFTADTQFCPERFLPYYEKADIIFHDCETKIIKSGVHAHYDQLVTLDQAVKNKMWLYHYSPVHLPDAKKDGFKGFVTKGQTFNFKKLI